MTKISEFSLIDRLLSHQQHSSETSTNGVLVGPGDDCAVLQPNAMRQQVVTTDTLIAGRHFLADIPAELIGYRALAVNLSDIAAMAAQPKWLLCSLNLPLELANNDFIDRFAQGFFALAQAHGTTLVGGNMTRDSKLSISVTVIGETQKPITRSGAQAGDLIFTTGSIGGAAMGLATLQEQLAQKPSSDIDWLDSFAERYCKPIPRVEFASAIAEYATALIDISDGFAQDLTHLAKASDCLAVVNGSQLPRHPDFFGMDVRTVIERQLNGGDDYELIGTCNKTDFPAVAKAAKAHDTPLQMVGFIKPKDTTQQTYVDWQNILKVPVKGYDHFL